MMFLKKTDNFINILNEVRGYLLISLQIIRDTLLGKLLSHERSVVFLGFCFKKSKSELKNSPFFEGKVEFLDPSRAFERSDGAIVFIMPRINNNGIGLITEEFFCHIGNIVTRKGTETKIDYLNLGITATLFQCCLDNF